MSLLIGYRVISAVPKLLRSTRAVLMSTHPSPLNYLDIGARDGIPRRWQLLERSGKIAPVYVEADAEEANELRKRGRTLCAALGSESGATVELKITRAPWLTSVLEPMVEKWPSELASGCEVVERRQMTLSRLDEIWPAEFGDPHFVKIDTQGYDLEVLKGFGDLLERVLCLEVEVRIGQQYIDQATAADIYAFMDERKFDLVGLSSNGLQADRTMMVFNAFFINSSAQQKSAIKLWKLVNNIG